MVCTHVDLICTKNIRVSSGEMTKFEINEVPREGTDPRPVLREKLPPPPFALHGGGVGLPKIRAQTIFPAAATSISPEGRNATDVEKVRKSVGEDVF